MADTGEAPGISGALAAERGFVRLFGGYTVGLAGGTLLVNERIPIARFNRVQTVRVAPERQAQFFEAALDHYFQRALRPTFRVTLPVPSHVDATLRGLAFRPRALEECWLVAGPERPPAPTPSMPVRGGDPSMLSALLPLLTGAPETLEFRRQLEVGWRHPNPGERLVPFWVQGPDADPWSAGLAYLRGSCLDIESVVTPPDNRGRGAATSLVHGILGDPVARGARYVALRSSEPRLAARLAPAGFEVADRARVYDLPSDADLVLRKPPATGRPFWRPERRG
jgi:hypothetical protein